MASILNDGSVFSQVWRYRYRFLGMFVGVFAVLIALLTITGLLPDEFMPAQNDDRAAETEVIDGDDYQAGADTTLVVAASDIARVSIPKVGIDVTVLHPQSNDVATLDEALKKGVVYYPGSGTPAQGNIFIFGHSTNWPVVQNQAYKAFNGLEDLVVGDEITLESAKADFVYRVKTVRVANDDEILVTFNTSQQMLTLSTCNTFGQKQERNVVEAELVQVLTK